MAILDLAEYQVSGVPDTVYYVPNFISEGDEKYLLNEIHKTPAPRWTQLLNRRLQNWGGIPTPKGMIAETIPHWLQQYVDRVNLLKIFGDKSANHVLLNEYKPGQGIMPHLDGDMFYPTISTISLGSHTVIHFYKQEPGEAESMKSFDERKICSLYVEPRSLLVLQQEMYTEYLHGIDEVEQDLPATEFPNINNIDKSDIVADRGTRYSLTIRHVPKTSKLKIKFGK